MEHAPGKAVLIDSDRRCSPLFGRRRAIIGGIIGASDCLLQVERAVIREPIVPAVVHVATRRA